MQLQNRTVTCPHCHQALIDDGSLAGQLVSCPRCNGQLQLPRRIIQPDSTEVTSSKISLRTEPDSRLPLWFPVTLASLVISLIVVVGLLVVNRGQPEGREQAPHSGASESTPVQPESTSPSQVPEFKIINKILLGKWLEVNVVVEGAVTEEDVRRTLIQVHKQVQSEYGGIAVILYPSREHYQAEMGQWLGLLKSMRGESPSFQIQTKNVVATTLRPDVRFGLSEKERLCVWHALVVAQDRVDREVETSYPIEFPITRERDSVRTELLKRLTQQYLSSVAEAYGLSMDQANEIRAEALQENWPFPKLGSL